MGNIMRAVLVPSSKLIERMNLLYNKWSVDKYDAIHLRIGGKRSDSHFFVEYDNEKVISTTFKCANVNALTNTVYLASDSLSVKKQSTAYFSKHIVLYDKQPTKLIDSQVVNTTKCDDLLLIAASELMLLGNSQTCYMTFKSTYSYVGCSMSKGLSFIVVKQKSK